MNLPSIKIENNNYYHKLKNNSDNLKFKIIDSKYKRYMNKVDNFTSNDNQYIGNYNFKKILPKIYKNHNVILPTILNRVDNNSYRNENISYINNSRNNKYKINGRNAYKDKNLYNFYHPWSNNSYNNKEINSILSYCLDVTKINISFKNKKRINDCKLNNKLLRDVEKRYNIANLYQKLNNIKINKINQGNSTENNSSENNIFGYKEKKINNLRYLNPNKNDKNNCSNENTYSNLNKRNLFKNITNNRNDFYLRDYTPLKMKEKQSSSFNNSFCNIHKRINDNFMTDISSPKSVDLKLKNNYQTIKIKNLSKEFNNDNDEKNVDNNKFEKIRPNSLFLKS
jgi:hypothetical protein